MKLIDKLSNHNFGVGSPFIKFKKDKTSDACQMVMQTKFISNPKTISTSTPLGLLYMDIFGPTRTIAWVPKGIA